MTRVWTDATETVEEHHLTDGGVLVGVVERCCCIWVPRVVKPENGYREQVGESCDLDDAKAMVERSLA